MSDDIDFWSIDRNAPVERDDALYERMAETRVGARAVDRFLAGARADGELVWLDTGNFFNARVLDADPGELIFAGSQMDVLALDECGFGNAVALVGGNRKPHFPAFGPYLDKIERLRRIVIAVKDIPLREELARRFGRHRCWVVAWPEGCAGAAEMLRTVGSEAVSEALTAAVPYPIEGLQRIVGGTLAGLRSRPAPAVMSTGTMSSDNVLKFPTEGRLIVVTGFPSSGKTSWLRYVMIHTAKRHDRRWVVFSPESQPWEQFVAQCAEAYTGKIFYPVQGISAMTDDEIADAEKFLGEHITMLVCDAERQELTLDWLLERAAACVLRDGATDFLIDPWNEMSQHRGDVSETDFIGRCLQRCKGFGLRYGCNVWIIAHPGKPLPLRPGEKRNAPGPYDISGSAHWANKTDVGVTIHSAEPGLSEVHVWKCRFRRWGQKGRLATMEHDELTGRYSSPTIEFPEPPNDR
jgi:twinkle protein